MTTSPDAQNFLVPEPSYAKLIAPEVQLTVSSVAAVIALLDEGCTVPFVARYRKEATGGAEDFAIQQILDRLQFHRELWQRRNVILESIASQGKLTPELQAAIVGAVTRAELEDLYLPYRPKRRTRATIAKERGLEPLADRMWAQAERAGMPEEHAAAFVDGEKGVATVDDALQGARDILAERITETADWRARVRELTWRRGRIRTQVSRGKAGATSKFTDYYDYSEPVERIPSHRILAILRGEQEGFLSMSIQPETEQAVELVNRAVVTRRSIWDEQLRLAVADGCDRLLLPQIETEIRVQLKETADLEAIRVFATNLRELLMAPPLGGRPVMAIDPGFRTGCKVVVLDATGRLLDHGVVYPTEPRNDVVGTESALDRWFRAHPDLVAVAIGNGTGGRETFAVVRSYLKKRDRNVLVVSVNESGASVYSASEVARDELPEHDVTVRGAVSIGRRLQDPLAELVKIDPKAIGVGQYQHDVDQKLLRTKLDEVVEWCVNQVGVDLNTASMTLLQHISGLGPKLARSIVTHRDQNGPFPDRAALGKVAGLGRKTFEQAAGFLRVKGGKNPLDDTAVHPERYALVERIARDAGRPLARLAGDPEAVRTIDLRRYVDDSVGLYTLQDIVTELEKPGRDPRRDFATVDFRDDVQTIEDLTSGMILNGTVTNVTNFGAFVDIGVHQDGLVHVSQIADRFVRDPAEELHVGQTVRVKVLEIDLDRRRIALSIKQAAG
ncbi:MAG: RNA-binding transcriptional accessory protein [Candidatus Eisenbacteria bacterium]|uniref:RNA-binding transcriptional accessory protein n=1 Tax=Eiseniibacteriota bacterium TaxID=2212470 RepID=A0A956LWG5_UNCEI|nr:RNA-binding transcriptional accessory protein [Candidatus Eisenbacteria bacterium]